MDWTPLTNWLSEHGGLILLIIALSVALYYLLRHFVPIMIRRTVSRAMKGKTKTAKQKRTDTLSAVFIDVGTGVIAIIAIFTILAEVGVNLAPALAGLGVVGIAVGFGAQSLVKDIFNGLFILLENQYGVGDWIQIAGIDGLVQEVGLRKTVVRDFNGTVHNIPNGEIKISSNLTKEWARVNMDISVGYGEDLDRVISIINEVGKKLAEDPDWGPSILKAPETLRVQAFEDSGIAIRILGETKPMQQWAVMGELRLRLKKAFDEEGIEIPWPHTKVFFGNAPGEIEGKKTTKQTMPPPTTKPSKRRMSTILPEEDGGG